MAKSMILACPACGGDLDATRLHCGACDVAIEGRFATSPFAALTEDQQAFLNTFISARGNIKLMERHLGISYPTVRSRLDAVRRALGLPDLAAGEAEPESGALSDVLDRLASGELSVDDAIDSLE